MLLSIFWWWQQKKKEPLSFWSYYRGCVLLPGTLLEVIQIRHHCYEKKDNVRIIVIITSQRQITTF